MVDPIVFTAKTNNEQHLLLFQKLDILQELLEETCGQVKINTPRITALEIDNKHNRAAIKLLYISIGTVVLGVIYAAFRTLGIPIIPPS